MAMLDDPAADDGADILPMDTTLHTHITVPIDAPLVTVETIAAGADPDIGSPRGRGASSHRDDGRQSRASSTCYASRNSLLLA